MSRTKTVFGSHSQLAHVWAQQTQPEGRAGNMFFDGPTIFSYGRHFAIATFVDAPGLPGSKAVLFTDRSYSISTSKHKNHVCHALNGLAVPVFTVAHTDAAVGRHTDNLKVYAARVEDSLRKASRARTYGELHMRNARRVAEESNLYRKAFKLRGRVRIPELTEALREKFKALESKRAAEARKREKERAAKQAEALADWLAGGLRVGFYMADPTYLRVRGDVVETSRGASVPVEDARRVLPLLLRDGVVCGPVDFTVGNFRVSEIYADGSIQAGCHVIPRRELEKVATTLGVVWARTAVRDAPDRRS